jgi:hypothetical protein
MLFLPKQLKINRVNVGKLQILIKNIFLGNDRKEIPLQINTSNGKRLPTQADTRPF